MFLVWLNLLKKYYIFVGFWEVSQVENDSETSVYNQKYFLLLLVRVIYSYNTNNIKVTFNLTVLNRHLPIKYVISTPCLQALTLTPRSCKSNFYSTLFLIFGRQTSTISECVCVWGGMTIFRGYLVVKILLFQFSFFSNMSQLQSNKLLNVQSMVW